MTKKFIKNFSNEGKLSSLPDSDYWLSREEIILTNLYLRGGAVPKVQIKNLIDKSLTLQNVGPSLDEYFFNPEYPKITDAIGFQVFLSSNRKLLDLFNLGTLHLDIALRNIASTNLSTNEIYILDFIHALSAHNQLQKPLPLIPTPELHHPLLIEALEIDWKNYFSNIGKPCPKLDKTLTISNQEFSNYWVGNIQVQLLCKNLALLSHGLGNLAIEFSHAPNLEVNSKKLFHELGLVLRNLDEGNAVETLKYAERTVTEAMNKVIAAHFGLSNATPIPNVQENSNSSDINPLKPNGPDITYKSSIFNKDKNTLQSTLEKNTFNQPIKSNLILKLGICWSLIGLNIYLIDAVVVYKKIILSNEIILWILICGIIIPIALCFSFFRREKSKNNIQRISIAIAVIMQFFVIASYPKSTFNQIWTWIPSLAIGIGALILNYKSNN